MSRPDHPIALNLARVVHRLLIDPRGWRVDRMMSELGIQPRTYRKYRAMLQDHGDLVVDPSGRWRVQEIREGNAAYLRLARDEVPPENRDGFLGVIVQPLCSTTDIGAFTGHAVKRAVESDRRVGGRELSRHPQPSQ